jgi:hypothetical protein
MPEVQQFGLQHYSAAQQKYRYTGHVQHKHWVQVYRSQELQCVK